ncbi:WD40-repeat-containing domain protein [Pilaira anomala]|nr:WD40-repeat-containing domain protein [Pilaira anomala]
MPEEQRDPLFKYIVKERAQNVIVISDSDDEDERRTSYSDFPAPLTPSPVQPTPPPVQPAPSLIQSTLLPTQPTPPPSPPKENIQPGDASHPIALLDSDCEEEDDRMESMEGINHSEEEPQAIIPTHIQNDHQISEINQIDQIVENEMMISADCTDTDMETNSLFGGEVSEEDLDIDSISTTDSSSFRIPETNLSLIDDAMNQDVMMDPPLIVNTLLPKDTDITCTLRQIELYLQSVTEIPTPSLHNETRSRRTRDTKSSPENNTPYEPINPYVPNRAWYNSTWEDWAQLDAGDILHCPFTADEIQIIQDCVERNVRRSRFGRELVDFWQYVSTRLPGRSPLDCRCYWSDYLEKTQVFYSRPVIINRLKDNLRNTSRHTLLVQRNRTGLMNHNSMRNIHISNMSREYTISEGSGDAIALAIFKDTSKSLKVAVGSLCDEHTQYNMPGNLRLWDAETKNCSILKGHFIRNEEDGPEIWRTVTDVKMSKDQSLIYTSSHEGTANIWKSSNGKLVSTLQFHSKNINQLAVDYSQNENVLASCSNDGSATVWRIGSNGKTGSGSICELDPGFFVDPEVDCVEFGRNASRDKLFLGVNNKDFDHPGYIEVYDSETGTTCNRFNSMKGSVSSLAISTAGNFIISGNYNRYDNMSGDGFIHLQDIGSKESVTRFYTGHHDVNIVAISPCDTYVASGNADKEKNEVLVFDVRNPRKVLHVLSHDQTLVNQSLIAPDSSIGIGGLYWMSDSRTIITGGGDSTVKVWSIEGSTKLLNSYQTSNCVTSLTVHEDSMTIAAGVAGAQGIVHVWQP